MASDQFPSPVDSLLKHSLYTTITFREGQVWDVLELIYFDGTYDSHCTKCGRDSTFKAIAPQKPNAHDKSIMIQLVGGHPRPPKMPMAVHRVQSICTRDNSHTQDFLYYIDSCSKTDGTGKQFLEYTIQKIGQQPSYADIHLARVKKYSHVLSKAQLGELSRANGLASHDVGVGAYIYLRRVFEALIEEAHLLAASDSGWDEQIYIKSRMSEKIGLLKNHLPTFVVQHPEMYSLLSKGVHELSEAECLLHFETLRLAIELVLDEKLERKKREQKIQEANSALAKAITATKA